MNIRSLLDPLAMLSPKRFGLISNGNWEKDKLQNFTDDTTAVLGSAVLNYLRKVAEEKKTELCIKALVLSLARFKYVRMNAERQTFLSA